MRTKRPPFFEAFKKSLRPTVKAIVDQLPAAATGPMEIDLCEFTDVLEFSMALRRRNPVVASILLKRERRDELWFITHVVLDNEDRLIRGGRGLLGRTFYAKALDDELRDLFGDAESVGIALPLSMAPAQPEQP